MVRPEVRRRREIISQSAPRSAERVSARPKHGDRAPWLQSHQAPVYFPIGNLQPGHTRGRTAIRPSDATGIQKQDPAPSLISRHVGMTMQNHIDIFRRTPRRNVLQAKSYSVADKIDNQRPLEIAVAISAHHRDRPASCPQLIENSFRTDIAEVPDFIRLARQGRQYLWKLVVRIGENEYAQRFFHLTESRTKAAALKFRRDPLRPLGEALTFSRVIQ